MKKAPSLQPAAEKLNREDDLPDGWATTTLGQIAERIQYGYTASATQAKGPRFLRITDIQDGKVDWESVPSCEISEDDAEKYSLKTGDIVFARTGATTGKSFLIGSCPQAVFASYLIRVRGHQLVNPAFLIQAFNTPQYWAFIMDNVAGNAQPNCNASKLAALTVPVAPAAEQERIVATCDHVAAKIDASRVRLAKVPKILKAFRQSVLAAACSGRLTEDWREKHPDVEPAERLLGELLQRRQKDWASREFAKLNTKDIGSRDAWRKKYKPPFLPQPPDDIKLPENWAWATVSQVSRLDVGFAFKSTEFSTAGIPLLRGENVEPGALRWEDVRFWPKNKLQGLEGLLVQAGDIILAMDRPIISSGLKIARATTQDTPCLLVQRVTRFKIYEPEITGFVYSCLQNQNFVDYLLSQGLTGSDLPHITGTALAEYTIPLPPLEEQQEIVRRVEALFKLADKIEKRVEAATKQADKLTQSILTKAFRGELVPTEAELARQEGRAYETAAELLARIRSAREKSAAPANGPKRRGARGPHVRV